MSSEAEVLVSNPCFQFQLIHNHATDLRRAQNESRIIMESSHQMKCRPSRDIRKACMLLSRKGEQNAYNVIVE
jgi:hypothetical protein